MKRFVFLLLACVLLLSGCSTAKKQNNVQMANPWSDHDSLSQAETAVGFSLEMPETVGGVYKATLFRTLSGQLLEVVYTDGDYKVTVRKQEGEGQDISGDYTDYRTIHETVYDDGTVTAKTDGTAVLMLIDHGGYSYSLYAPNGYPGDSAEDFRIAIFE